MCLEIVAGVNVNLRAPIGNLLHVTSILTALFTGY